MKRFLTAFLLVTVCTVCLARGQNDAAVAAAVRQQAMEETINKLKGELDTLSENRMVQEKRLNDRITELSRDLSQLREQTTKPHPVYATADEVKSLREAIEKVDHNRKEDSERLRADLKQLADALAKVATIAARPPPPQIIHHEDPPPQPTTVKTSEEGFDYTIKSGDNFERISKFYAAKGIKVSAEQIAKANPKVTAGKLIVGHKLWIPVSSSTAPADGSK